MDAIDLKHENLRLKDLVEQRGLEINALAAELKAVREIERLRGATPHCLKHGCPLTSTITEHTYCAVCLLVERDEALDALKGVMARFGPQVFGHGGPAREEPPVADCALCTAEEILYRHGRVE